MKKSNYLKFFLSMLACVWAFQAHAIDWTGSAPTAGEKYYLYNVGQQKFVAHGANWGTRAISDEAGIQFTLEESDGKYRLNSGIGGTPYLGVDQYVDQAALDYTFEEVSGKTNVYYLKFTPSDNVTRFLLITNSGVVDKASTNTGGTWTDEGCQWMLITKAERDQMLANGVGSDTDPLDISYKYLENNRSTWFTEPYNNPTTIWSGWTLNGANDYGSSHLRDRNGEVYNTNFDNAINLTGLPQGKYRYYVTGYYRDGSNAASIQNYLNGAPVQNVKIYASGASTQETALQSFGVGASTTQLVDEGYETVDGTDYYRPNSQTQATAYFFNNRYPEQYVDAVVGTDGTLTIGVKKETTIGGDWTLVDKMRLEYRGEYHGPADGGKYYLYNVGAKMFIGHGDQWGYHALQDEAGLEMTLEETDGKYRIATGLGYLGSDGYCDKNASQALAVYYEFIPVEGVDNAYYLKFTDSADGNEKYLLFTNNAKYANKATTITGGTWPEGYSQWKLFTKAERDAMLANMVGINGEPVTEENTLDISYQIPNNHTTYYTNVYSTDDPFGFKSLDNGALEGAADNGTLMDRNAQGWTGSADRKWDANMTFTGLPEGKYRFYVTGFYRDGGPDGAYTRSQDGSFDARAKIYMIGNEATTTTDLQSIGVGASESALGGNEYNQSGFYIPNGQNGAAYYFFNGKYPEQYVEGEVGLDGQLKIGVKVDKTLANNWLVVDKVRLVYLGPDVPMSNVSGLLVNPTFDGTDGWTSTGHFAANTATMAENFATAFDIHQDVEGLEPGVYKISLQGFFRDSRNSADGGTYSAADVARNVRTIGDEDITAFLYARVGDDLDNDYTEGKNSLLSIFDETYGTTGGADIHSSILPNVPGGVNPAHEAFEAGLYADNSMIVEVTESGKLRVGIKKETTTDREWTAFDNMKLFKLDCTLEEALASEFEKRKNEAVAIMKNADYANIPDFSTEYQALDDAVTTDVSGFTTPYEYYDVLDAMRPALNAFKASKYWYDRFKGVYDAAVAVGVDVTAYSTISMGQAPDAIKALVVATENAVNNTLDDEGDAKYGDCTEVYMKGWTIQQFGTGRSEHWDGTADTEYYDKNGNDGQWYMSQTVTLPAGDYVLKVAGRANWLDNIQEYTVTFGNNIVHLPTLGNATPGIATTGEADYAAGEKGWEWRYVPLKVTTAGDYEIRITFAKDKVWSWSSAADVQLFGTKEALAEGLLLLADKLREKIEEIDKAYYGSSILDLPVYEKFTDLLYNDNTYWEKNVAEMFRTKNTEATYDQRQSYVYDYDKDGTAETVTASSASTAIGLVNYYNLMHGAKLSTADYRKAMLVMQTKIDMADANAASYVYTRRALLRAETFADLQGDVYENNSAAVATLQEKLAECDATLKHAIALASGTDGTLDSQEEIVGSWDDNTHWIADNIKTSALYKNALDDIKAATREFIDAITVKEGQALNITDVFLYNPSFDYNNPDGWTANGSTRPHNCNTETFAAYATGQTDITTTYHDHYVEFYELNGNPGAITGNYNSFQTVTGLPAGVYKFTATGSYRQLQISNSAPDRALGNEDITAEIYASGTHMAEVPVEYTVVEETGEVDEEGNPITQEVTYTRMEEQPVTDTDRSMPLFSLYTDADQTGLVRGLNQNENKINTVYGAVPVDFNNYMPVVNHYDGNTVMFGVTATDGTEDVTVGVRDNYAADRQHSWAVLDNFELFYISPNIVFELNKEWKARVAIAQGEYDANPSPQASKYGVALATYLDENYDPTTAIADSDLGLSSDVLSGLTTAEKNELKYNKALRDLHVAQNDYEAALYWFDQLAAANAVANSFPYLTGVKITSDDYAGSTEDISYDDYNVMLESPVDANTTMENARDKNWAVRTLADGLFGNGKYYDVDLTSQLGELTTWTTGAESKAIASSTDQVYKNDITKIEPDACYGSEGWKFNISKTVTLEKGLYMFKIAARRSGGVTKCDIKVSGENVGTLIPVANSGSAYTNYSFIEDGKSFTKGDVTIAVPRSWNAEQYNGDKGYGIAADGSTDYTAGNNFGWQWEYIPFVVAKGSDVTFTIDSESKSYYTWASFAEAQLLQGPIPTSVNENNPWDLEKCYANAHVTRNITNTTEAKTWGTIVLPYNKELPSTWDIRQQVSKNESQDEENNNIIDFQRPKYTEGVTGEEDPSDLSSLDDETVVINRPYVIQVQDAVTNPWSDNRVQIDPSDKPYTENTYVEMIGMYNPGEIAIGDFYIAHNVFWRVTEKAQPTKGLRVYFHVKENNNPDPNEPDPGFTTDGIAKKLIGYGVKFIDDDDEAIVSEDGGFVDGINTVDGDANNGEYYDLQGRRVATPRHGVYIQNGKKRVVK